MADQLTNFTGTTAPAFGVGNSTTVLENSMIRVCDGRLSLDSTDPAPMGRKQTVSGGTVYLLPYNGNRIALKNATTGEWQLHTFTNPSVSIASLAAGAVYDVLAQLDGSNNVTLFLSNWRRYGQGVTGASNATPIVITAASHGLQNGDEVYMSGVIGNPAANGVWVVANVATNTFELTGSVGNGAYLAGGYFSARQSGLTMVRENGAVVMSGNTHRRLLGTVLASAAGVTTLSPTFLGLANYHNRLDYGIEFVDEVADVNRNTGSAFVRWKAAASPHLSFVAPWPDQLVRVEIDWDVAPSAAGVVGIVNAGYNRVDGDANHGLVSGANRMAATTVYTRRLPQVGPHTLSLVVFSTASTTFHLGRLRAKLTY